jgi:hypothetical protein
VRRGRTFETQYVGCCRSQQLTFLLTFKTLTLTSMWGCRLVQGSGCSATLHRRISGVRAAVVSVARVSFTQPARSLSIGDAAELTKRYTKEVSWCCVSLLEAVLEGCLLLHLAFAARVRFLLTWITSVHVREFAPYVTANQCKSRKKGCLDFPPRCVTHPFPSLPTHHYHHRTPTPSHSRGRMCSSLLRYQAIPTDSIWTRSTLRPPSLDGASCTGCCSTGEYSVRLLTPTTLHVTIIVVLCFPLAVMGQ